MFDLEILSAVRAAASKTSSTPCQWRCGWSEDGTRPLYAKFRLKDALCFTPAEALARLDKMGAAAVAISWPKASEGRLTVTGKPVMSGTALAKLIRDLEKADADADADAKEAPAKAPRKSKAPPAPAVDATPVVVNGAPS